MTSLISIVVLTLTFLAGYQQVKSQGNGGYKGFDLT